MRNTLFILLLFLLAVACQKKKASKNPSIEIGNAKYVDINNHNVLVKSSGYQDIDAFALDIDADGNADILFESYILGSPGMGMHEGFSIEALHSGCHFAGVLGSQERWVKHDTSYIDNPQTGETIVMRSENYACTQLDSEYNLAYIIADVVYTTFFSSGETLNKTDYFSNLVSNLVPAEDHSSVPLEDYTSNDSTYMTVTVNYAEACTISNKTSGYLGIKLNTSDGEKLGWVKLSITDGYIISIESSGIQR
jgi:hypothetical protein